MAAKSGRKTAAEQDLVSQRQKAAGWLQRLRSSRPGRLLLLWATATLVIDSFFFSQLTAKSNYDEVFPGELVFLLAMHALTGLLIAAVVSAVGRSLSLTVRLVMVVILAWLAVGYDARLDMFIDFLRALSPSILPSGQDTPFLSLAFMTGLVVLVYSVGRGLDKLQKRFASVIEARSLGYGVLVIIAVVFLGQAVKVAPAIIEIVPQSRTVAPSLGSPVRPASDKPDIYYVVLDRYTNDNVLKEQFGYDNSPFTDFLKGQGFTVKEDALANYPFTDVSVSSTLAAGYTDKLITPYLNDDVQSHTLFHNIIRQAPVIKALKDQGYKYYNVGSWYNATNQAPLADVDYPNEDAIFLFGHNVKRLRNLESLQFEQSPYYRLMKSSFSWWPTRIEQLPNERLALSQLETLNELAESKEQGGRFILAHLLVTHPPYFFNADGSITPYKDANNYGKTARQKYVDTIQFINGQMEAIVAKAVEHSGGKAVFLFSADEGPFPSHVYPGNSLANDPNNSHSMDKWPQSFLELKFSILQAARIPVASADQLSHLSSVNLFRIVLNSYLGYQLDYLPECHFTLGKHSEFIRYDIAPRLVGSTNDYCTTLLDQTKDGS